MKIDANHAVRAYAHTENVGQEMKASAPAGIVDTSGVSFQKNQEDSFVAQLEREQNISVENPGGAAAKRSRTDVLNDLVTEKDLAAFKEYSDDPENEELDVIVTVVEKIKIQLATYCDDYDSGMPVDDLSMEQLEKLSDVTGNVIHVAKKLSENNLPVTEDNIMDCLSAMELARNTGLLTEDAVKNCLAGGKEFTIENLYLAQHSGAYSGQAGYYVQNNGYYVKNASGVPEELRPQIERLLEQAGMPVDENSVSQAEWLVDNQIPLTPDNLEKYKQLRQYMEDTSKLSEEEMQENTLNRMVEALLEGKRPFDASAVDDASVIERSRHAVEVLGRTTDEQIYRLTSDGQEVTIVALDRLQGAENASAQVMEVEFDITFVTARRRLEEVRMQMTVQSGAVMLRNGIDVETSGMQKLIDELKAVEDNYYKELLTGSGIEADADSINACRGIVDAAAVIASSPAELIGTVTFTRTALTVEQIKEQGVLLEEKYRQANEAYEQVMTRPRSDMGDSIQKAFRNVDEILGEMGLELTNGNQRAVRILGYNSIEITYDNIAQIKEADMQVNTMLEGLKPSVVLQMIKDGYNPLDKTVEEVNHTIAQMQHNSMADEEKYSEFLWNLEHSDGISQNEREAYVGIYRLLHQIERTDGAVVGAMVEQGAALTMRNLLTGIRSKKHASMDYKVGEMDGVEGTKTNSITGQIESGFAYIGQLAGRARRQLAGVDVDTLPDPDKLLEMSAEAFAETVQEAEQMTVGSDSYQNQQLQALRQACAGEEEILAYLTSQNQAVTVGSILAAGQLFGRRGSLFKELRVLADGRGEEAEQELAQALEKTADSFTDEETAGKAYDSMLDTAQELVRQSIQEENVTYEQMRDWKLLSHQLRLCGSMAEQKEYHIPLRIGDDITSMHVRFDAESEEKGSVSLTWETARTGRVAARFTAKDGSLDGYVVAQNREVKELFAGSDGELRQMIEQAGGLPVGRLDYIEHEEVDLLKFAGEVSGDKTDGQIGSGELYRTAKAFMGFVAAYAQG